MTQHLSARRYFLIAFIGAGLIFLGAIVIAQLRKTIQADSVSNEESHLPNAADYLEANQ